MCMDQHSIPTKWKHHLITPIPKSGNPSSFANYRPISLLCVTSKVLESLIYNKVIDFIQPKLSSQHGFLKNRSCLTQLLTSLSSIYCSLDNKSSTDVIFLDLHLTKFLILSFSSKWSYWEFQEIYYFGSDHT